MRKWYSGLALLSLISLTYGQSTLPENTPHATLYDIPEIYIIDVHTDAAKYGQSGTVRGDFTVKNFDADTVVGLVSSYTLVGELDENQTPGIIVSQKKGESFDLGAGESKTLSFSYTLPPAYAGEGFHIQVAIDFESDTQVTWKYSPSFIITGEKGYVRLFDVTVTDDLGKSYPALAGPTLYSETGKPQKLTLQYALSNMGGSDFITLHPQLTYRKKFDTTVVGQSLLPEMTLEPGKDSAPQKLEIPTFTPAGVYQGTIQFLDVSGRSLAPDLEFQWIVSGPQARIDSVSSQVIDDQATLSVLYSGIPYDVFLAETTSPSEASLKITLLGQDRTPLNQTEDMIDLTRSGSLEKILTLPTTKDTDHLIVSVTIEQGGVVLDSYENILPLPTRVGLPQWILVSLIFLFVCLIIIFMRKIRKTTATIVLFCIIIGGGFHVVPRTEALDLSPPKPPDPLGIFDSGDDKKSSSSSSRSGSSSKNSSEKKKSSKKAAESSSETGPEGCVANTLSAIITSPYPAQEFVCGDVVEICGSTSFPACENNPVSVTVNGKSIGNLGARGGHGWYTGSFNFCVDHTIPIGTSGAYDVPVNIKDVAGACTYTKSMPQTVEVSCCQGPFPQHSTMCEKDDGSVNRAAVASCTSNAKCEYICNDGYKFGPEQATALSNAAGTFANITKGGSGYSEVPNVTVSGGTCTTLPTATAVLSQTLEVTVTNKGKGYTAVPAVTVTGGSCIIAPTAQAVLEHGYIASVGLQGALGCTLTTPMTLTIAAPSVTVPPAPITGTGAPITATATVAQSTTKTVTGVTLTGAVGCTVAPTLVIAAPGAVPATTGTQAIATATGTTLSAATALKATITTPGTGYATAPTVTLSSSCPNTITASSTVAGGSVTGIQFAGSGTCTAAPSITIGTPGSVSGGGMCTPLQCLGFPKPTNATYCAGDTALSGNVDLMNTKRGDTSQCTSNQKCEWFCPADNPFFCEAQNTCVKTQNDCTSNVCKTSAPSELKVAVDQPFIQCDAIDTTNTHFRYKITSGSASSSTATAVLRPASYTTTIGNAGSGYSTTTNPTLTIDANNVCATDPLVSVTVGTTGTNIGKITEVTVTNPGICSGVPTVTIAPPTSGTTATVTLKPASFSAVVTNAGSGYPTSPAPTFTVDANDVCTTNPNVSPNFTNGSLVSVSISGTSNCTGIPTITLPAPPPGSGTGTGTANTYISPLFTVGTSVKHPTTFNTGTYTVSCLYGTPANTNSSLPDFGMTAGACTKPMVVNDSSQGCSRIFNYRGTTLSQGLGSDVAFDASFRCGSRNVVTSTTDTKAYRLHVGTSEPAYLLYDKVMSDLFGGLAIGPVSTQTQNYSFTTTRDITCAVKVGDGYSTNNACQARACVGAGCGSPETFIVVPSLEATCTTQDSVSYDIGCNPSSADYVQCVRYFFDGTGDTEHNIKINGTSSKLECKTTIPDGAFGPVKTCTVLLPSTGNEVTIFAGDVSSGGAYSFQTTSYTLHKDDTKPTGTLEYYFTLDNQKTRLLSDQTQYWQRNPVTAVITCTDGPGAQDGAGCACHRYLADDQSDSQNDTQYWSLGVPSTNASIGPDRMEYVRNIIANNGTLPGVKVQDTAKNESMSSFAVDIGVDSIAPKIVATGTTTVSLTFIDDHVGASGLWKPLSALNDAVPSGSGIIKNGVILYRKGLKSNLSSLEFDANCSLPQKNTNYFKYKEGGVVSSQSLTLSIASNEVVAYCVQDNAGNVNRGYYPNQVLGCFSESSMPVRPVLSPMTDANYYAPLLRNRLGSGLSNAEKYGYSFSADATQASCFRGILSNNVTTLVVNHYQPIVLGTGTPTKINWETSRALGKVSNTANASGYYYYTSSATSSAPLMVIDTNPGGVGPKAVIVEGGNIQINSNIEYSGGDKTLILVARKNGTGNSGNIYIDPSVTRIDAILIADGGYIANATNGVAKDWITDLTDNSFSLANRLWVNGRIYSYNTRGGSVVAQASPGTDFNPITGSVGKIFNGSTLVTNAIPSQAGAQDLERLRALLPDGNAQCSTHVNYQQFTSASLPALLTKPNGFNQGNCGF